MVFRAGAFFVAKSDWRKKNIKSKKELPQNTQQSMGGERHGESTGPECKARAEFAGISIDPNDTEAGLRSADDQCESG